MPVTAYQGRERTSNERARSYPRAIAELRCISLIIDYLTAEIALRDIRDTHDATLKWTYISAKILVESDLPYAQYRNNLAGHLFLFDDG